MKKREKAEAAPPPEADTKLDLVFAVFRPLYRVCDPYVEGIEHVDPGKPALFVGNHTTLGVLDMPFLYLAIHDLTGIYPRGLAHRMLFKNRALSAVMKALGAVEGTRENCTHLMDEGGHLLVFPGGSGEVCKTKNQKYQLLWKNRLGFVKMAAAHGYPIIPFASVGAEECYDIAYDYEDFLKSRFGSLLRKLPIKFEDILFPVVKGWRGTPLPKLERFYFKFLPPIPTASVDPDDDEACGALRDAIKGAVESAINDLIAIQKDDPARHDIHLSNLLKKAKEG